MSTIYLVMREGVHPPYREDVDAAFTSRELARGYCDRCDDEEDDMEPHRDYRFWVRPMYLNTSETSSTSIARP